MNPDESRLRSGWRVAATAVAALAIFLPVQAVLKSVLPEDLVRQEKIDLLLACFALVATLVVIASRKWVDKRPVLTLGLGRKSAIKDGFFGFLISSILVAIITAIEMGFGWLRLEIVDQPLLVTLRQMLYTLFFTGITVAWWENLFFVGYMFQNIKDGCGLRCSFVINCLIFGAVHAANPNATIWAFLGIVLIHSYELFGFMRTGRLWLILGIHAGWNFFQGLAGFSVSGQRTIQLVVQENRTPLWFGGGEFGPEAGAVILLTTVVAYALIMIYSRGYSDKPGAAK